MMPGREHTMNNKRHKHGGDIYSEACTLDYSANINPLGPPSSVIEAVYRSMEQIVNYPDVQCRKLCHAIAEHEYVKEEQVICTNGASELLYAFAAALKPKKALLLEPGFAEYEAALSAVGCEIFYYPLGEEKGYALDLAYLEALSDDLDMIILCNPNNPTGVLIQQPLLVRIAEKCEKYGIHFLLDECFHEFLMAPDVACEDHDNGKSHGSKEEEAVDAKCGFEASTVLFTDQKCCGWYDDAQKQCCDKNEFCNS